MKPRLPSVTLCSLALVLSTAALAYDRGAEVYASARVLESRPVYETVEVPEGREVCFDEPVTYYEPGPRHRRAETNEALGLIVGGLLGNQIGSGSGRAAATFGGAVLGSAIARDANRERYYEGGRRVTREERVCEWRDAYRTERRLTGFDVTYDYNGAVGHVFSRREPGETIRVRVAVEALVD
jgi:uncharacterized protein YcfJ